MFNHTINGFFIKKDILVGREKKAGKKVFLITDITLDEETNKPLVFNTIEDLLEYKIDGKKISDILADKKELNIDNKF